MGTNGGISWDVLLGSERIQEIIENKIDELLATDAMRELVLNMIVSRLPSISEEQFRAALDDVMSKGLPVKDTVTKEVIRIPVERYIRAYIDRKFSEKWVERDLKRAIDHKLRQICKDVFEKHKAENLVPEVMTRLAEEYANTEEE